MEVVSFASVWIWTIFVPVTRMATGETSVNWISSPCPSGCKCAGIGKDTSTDQLSIDCQQTVSSPDQLSRELDLLLSSNVTYDLQSLSIVNSPLRHVPRSVCRLTTLKSLRLDRNRLTALPDNCFTNLTSLVTLSAAENNITELQDGLFDSLPHLNSLSFSYCQISTIGLEVFIESAGLVSLRYIDLSWNFLTSLEPWPLILGMNGNVTSLLNVNFANNQIHQFTNKMAWNYSCGINISYVKADLTNNLIEHFTNILRGWNLSDLELWCIGPYRHFPGHKNPYTTVRTDLANNPFICDCKDYQYYIHVHSNPNYGLFYRAVCAAPADMIDKEINRISERIEQIICEITERCPAGCRCAYRPANSTLHVYCAATNLSVLPTELPELPKSYTRYKLDFSNNPYLHLEPREYFSRTSIIDLTNCRLQNIDYATWELLTNNSRVLLGGNQLSSLPSTVSQIKHYSTKTSLGLGRNPWRCTCDNSWMSVWLNSIKQVLSNPVEILCDSPDRLRGKNLIQISSKEFCVDPASEATKRATAISLSSVAAAAFVLVFAVAMVYRLRVKLYTRWKFHPFDRDECDGEDMQYDVFLCCSSSDHQPHGETILARLQQRGYRVCYHYNDFLPGLIVDSIAQAVIGSKRTVCFLTEKFLESSYCMYEFEAALHHNVAVKRSKRLIVLMAMRDSLENLNVDEAAPSSTASLRQYLRQYTYIDYSKDDWMDKLLYALPLHGLDQQQDDEQQPLLRNGRQH